MGNLTDQSFAQLEAALKVLANDYRGVAAFYFVDQLNYAQIVALVNRCGFPRGRGLVTSDVTASPPIPKLLP